MRRGEQRREVAARGAFYGLPGFADLDAELRRRLGDAGMTVRQARVEVAALDEFTFARLTHAVAAEAWEEAAATMEAERAVEEALATDPPADLGPTLPPRRSRRRGKG